MDEIQPCPPEPIASSRNSASPYPLNATLGELGWGQPRTPGTSYSAINRQKRKKERPEEYAKLLKSNNERYKKRKIAPQPQTSDNLLKQERTRTEM